MMKRFVMVLAVFAALALALPAMAADVKIRGDFNNRFMVYTDHNDWLSMEDGCLDDGSVDETWGEAKYRMWVEASTNDGKVKGVWAIEVGALHYGNESYRGEGAGGYSGDGVVLENRWMYTDFQLPWCQNKAMIRMGLQPFSANSFYWQETVMGVKFSGAVNNVDYELAWLRPWEDPVYDEDNDAEDMEAFYGRLNFKPADGLKAGIFAVYHMGDSDLDAGDTGTITSQHYELKKLGNKFDTQIFTIGTDGSLAMYDFFANWDFMYQTGSIDDANFHDAYTDNAEHTSQFIGHDGDRVLDEDFDLDAYFLHVDLGYKLDALKFTYTFWYASGDDDSDDDDFEAFMAVDVDRMDNICIFEGGFTDDDYFTEKPYLLDKGFIMNKLAVDYKANKKTTMGASFMYMMTAEDVEYMSEDGYEDEDEIGFEVDAYLKYKIYDNLEFAVNAGYLFAGDALDFYEVERDGDSDEDIFISTARIRYKF
ncbi:MAG: hypothetical protein U9P37_03930 [Pseudomonadota bacterium]|nr:hypothetical protein [Pseudomonadota bacterium]